jgi:hypothetical protein
MSSCLLTKEFDGVTVNVYGNINHPLFLPMDVCKSLDIIDIDNIMSTLDDEDKVEVQDALYLTDTGVLELCNICHNQKATAVKRCVKLLLQDIRMKRTTPKYYEEIEKNGHLYVIQTDAQAAYKVGKTKDVLSKRLKGLQTANSNDIKVILDFQTSNPDLLERMVHYILERYRCNSNREFFECKLEYIKNIVTICGNVLDVLKSSFQDITPTQLYSILQASGIQLELPKISPSQTSHFHNWLDLNLKYTGNSKDYVELKALCEAYLRTDSVASRTSGRFKKQIESYLAIKYPEYKQRYNQLTIKTCENQIIRPRGWYQLQMKI